MHKIGPREKQNRFSRGPIFIACFEFRIRIPLAFSFCAPSFFTRREGDSPGENHPHGRPFGRISRSESPVWEGKERSAADGKQPVFHRGRFSPISPWNCGKEARDVLAEIRAPCRFVEKGQNKTFHNFGVFNSGKL